MIPSSSDLPKLFNNHDLSFYWKIVRWPLCLGLIVDALALWDGQDTSLVPRYSHFVVFLYLAFLLAGKYLSSGSEAFFAGALVGVIFGLFLSVWRFVSAWQFHLFFNIFAETFLWLVLGGVFTFVAHRIVIWLKYSRLSFKR